VVLSKREWYILVAAVTSIVLLVGDRYVLKPALARLAQAKAQKRSLLDETAQAKSLFERRRLMEQKWQTMISGGLEDDASKTESRILHALRQWADDHGLMLSSIKPERVSGQGSLREITFLLAGTGTMSSVSQFLWQIEKAAVPIKILNLQLGSRNEQGDDMSLQLRLSAIYISAEQSKSEVENG
jgi:Tfp pilus assembly protein PilO